MSDALTAREGRDLVMPTDEDFAVMSYDQLMEMETMRVSGFSIVSKAELLGIPHIITKVTYWYPLEGRIGFVSCEATVGSADALKRSIGRGWVPNVTSSDELRLEPNERIVYNDGSTGVRRQLTMLFQHFNVIDVGHEDIEDGTRFDTPWPEWNSFTETRRQSTEIGNVPCVSKVPAPGGGDTESGPQWRPLVLRVDRGLSVSEYANQYTNEGQTYYLR